MEEEVWGNQDLVRLIFSYLRKEAYLKCKTCHMVLEWDPGKTLQQKYFIFYKVVCINCAYKEICQYNSLNCNTF